MVHRILTSLDIWNILSPTYHAHQFIFSFLLLQLLFIPCGRLSWLSVSFLLHIEYTVLYLIFPLCHDVGLQKLQTFNIISIPFRASSLPHSAGAEIQNYAYWKFCPQPIEYTCKFHRHRHSGFIALGFWKCYHRTDAWTDRHMTSFTNHLMTND